MMPGSPVHAARASVARAVDTASAIRRDLHRLERDLASARAPTWGGARDERRILLLAAEAASRRLELKAAEAVERDARGALLAAQVKADEEHAPAEAAAAADARALADGIAQHGFAIERDLGLFRDAMDRWTRARLARGGAVAPSLRGLADSVGCPITFAIIGIPDPVFLRTIVGAGDG